MLEILIAEDERLLRESLAAKLAAAGFAVRAVRNGAEALREFFFSKPDLLLLDVMMPVKGGLDVCREVRADDPDIPVLFLTALDSESAELGALSAGGDVFISKTVSDDVLLARINAALRRKIESGVPGAFQFAGWLVDAAKLSMRRGGGEEVPLSEREVAMLRCFADSPDEVFSKDFLLTRFWGVDFDGGYSALNTAISRLRGKLADAGSAICSVHSVGYAYRRRV